MDSDVSAEGDFDNESPRNRSRMSSNSDGHSSASPVSPDHNTDNDSSDEEKSSPAIKASSSDRESSPDTKHSEASEKESSPDIRNNEPSDRDSSPSKNDESDRESSSDIKCGRGSDRESSPDTNENRFRKSSLRSRESSLDAKDVISRESSPDVRNSRSGESSPDDAKNARSGESSLGDVRNAGSAGSSPDLKNTRSRESSPEMYSTRSRESSPDVKNTRSEDSSPEVQTRSIDSSPEVRDSNSKSRESSPDVKHTSYSDRETSPVKERSRSPNDTSPENRLWPRSPPIKQSSKSPCDSPYRDDQSTRKTEKLSPVRSENAYENTNGDLSPKSANRSVSVSSNRSDIASSLGSMSPSHFERLESNKTDDDESTKDKQQNVDGKKAIIDFADDLSDVSDIESNNSFGAEEDNKEELKETEVNEIINTEINEDKQLEDAVSLHMEGEEQLDFEAEEGECSPKAEPKNLIIKEKEEEPKKEKEQSDLEEGELTDDNDTKPEETERPVCRFFSRGHCTWGSNCRFIHPGVMDKGNYSMFDTVRPIVTPGGPPPNPSAPVMYPMFPPHLGHPHLAGERGAMIPPGGVVRKDEPPAESAWERGLRQAKEMIKKSSKRKETETDFEEKKKYLTLSQDEIDKENDYYSRHSGSPVKSPDLAEKWKMEVEAKSHRADPYANDLPAPATHTGGDVPPLGYYPPLHHGISRPDYWNPHRMGGLPYDDYGLRGPHMPYGPEFYSATAGRRYMHPNSYYPPRSGGVAAPPSHHPEFYDRKQKHKQYPGSSREVIVQKNDKPYKDESSPARYRNRREESPRIERVRDDEWADPWMRTKSPASGRRRSRKNTYSSGSSYSSSSESSRSSSRSSFSSRLHNSRSRSKVHSSGSRSHSSSRSASETQNRKKPLQFKLSPSSRTQLPAPKKNPKSMSPSLLSERRAATERAMHMNPPPPSPKIKARLHVSPNTASVGLVPPSSASPRSKGGLPDRLLAHSKAAVAAAMRSARSTESRSSKSSSGSSSSDSSSDSSDSSASSSSSSKSSKTPPVRTLKRSIPEEHIAVSQTVKPKAMDALKLSGQKQQIKLTLKGSGGSQSKRTAAVIDNSDTRKDRQPIVGKKRVAESSESGSDSDRMSPAKKSAKVNQKKNPSREELLRQLQAVEDAIARKRTKNVQH